MEDSGLKEYAIELLGGEDPLLSRLRDEAAAQGIPTIQVPFDLGRLLQILIVTAGARRVLEMGTLYGYSAILMARALPEDGRIITLEASEKHAEVARGNIERAGVAGKIDVRQGQALELLPKLSGEIFDLIFIDADKRGYPEYLEWALKLSRSGSVIVGDNVWRRVGSMGVEEDDPDLQGLVRFSREAAGNPRLLTTIVPRLDGSDAATVSVVR